MLDRVELGINRRLQLVRGVPLGVELLSALPAVPGQGSGAAVDIGCPQRAAPPIEAALTVETPCLSFGGLRINLNQFSDL